MWVRKGNSFSFFMSPLLLFSVLVKIYHHHTTTLFQHHWRIDRCGMDRMCQLVNGLSGNNLLTQAVQVISAAQTAANTAQSIGSLASLLHHFSSASSSSSPSSASGEQPSKSLMSQIAAALSSDDLSPPPSSPPSSTSSSLSGSSNFNPVLAVLDYLASNSNEKSAVSSLLPARRKKPMDLEELASEAAAAVSVTNKVPPTPCPSLEEYIAPVFARNYQGEFLFMQNSITFNFT